MNQTQTKQVTLTEDQFYSMFDVQPNHITGNESFGGLYETYGEEVRFINEIRDSPNRNRLWTVLEAEGNMFISSGYHLVNRIGYLLTKQPVPDDLQIEVELNISNISNKRYFLFGEQACRYYDDGEFDKIVGVCWDYFVWDENSSPAGLLETASGYEDWVEITEDEFNMLMEAWENYKKK